MDQKSILERLGGVLGRLGGVLGHLWVSWSSWVRLGCVLEASWKHLGGVLAPKITQHKPVSIWNGKRRSFEVVSLALSSCCGLFGLELQNL